MEPLHFIKKLLDIKDPDIQILDIINKDTHKEIIAKLDYNSPSCPDCGSQMKKYEFQKTSKIPYLETTGMPTRILLRKRRFKCYQCSKMMVTETSLSQKVQETIADYTKRLAIGLNCLGMMNIQFVIKDEKSTLFILIHVPAVPFIPF